MKKILLPLFLLVLGIFLATAQNTHAATFGISIYPPLFKLTSKPGKSITQVFKVENLSSIDKFYVARIVPFNKSDSTGNPKLDLRSSIGWLSYFSLSNSEIKLDEPFMVKANSSEQLILSISIPENSQHKDLYSTLLISTYNNEAVNSVQGSQVSASIGSNILITISDKLNPSTLLKVVDFYPTGNNSLHLGRYYFFDNISPITFTASVKNDGDFLAETKGVFKISNQKNEPIYLEGILPSYVLSENSRKLMSNHFQDFTFTPSLNQIGKYTVSIDIKTDNSNAENSIEIILIPIKLTTGIIAGISVLIFITNLLKKKN